MARPDLVFVGGSIFAGGRSQPGGVAVRDGRIAAVGTGVADLAGPGTAVVDLAGGLLLPGFTDAHVHPVYAGIQLLGCTLDREDGAEGYVEKVRAYAAAHRDLLWIRGGGWSMEAFPGGTPRKEPLDDAVPDRPVYLPNRDYHGAWVNSRALALAGIDRHTPDPPDGRIERDADGTPTGMLHEGAALLVGRLLPALTAQDMDTAFDLAQRYLFSLGVTGWQDAIVGSYLGQPDPLATYRRADADGRLRARVTGALWWDRERGLDQLDDLRERRTTGRRFGTPAVKIMLDGVAENFTAAMTRPYRDAHGHDTANAGLSFVDPADLREYVTRLDAEGFQVHFHALGDRAVREALDAVEAARTRNGPGGGRHHLAHLQVVQAADVPRFAQLGATANMQPLWACHEPQMDEFTIPFLGEGLATRQYPFGDLHRAGAHLAAGSDWPVSSPDPLWGVKVAVTRVAAGESGAPFLPEQALDLSTALTAYTAGSAWVNHHERVCGALEVGLAADLVVLDRDPFAGPVEEIDRARVVHTYVDGQQVH
ncbi:amidohydrolase [Phytohabitans houttuyneae]|uniref:Amidohydrolase n=1 Tax=Phytohabitans houttuyneae TaxID=1076126 RepID=A0A6V8KFV6_9ACTN|nr:amidohydrolase [Phytohabitans houttuyneae]GFJ84123.1 amidohydrolase [Phytohabitans houttuyneae]